MSKEIRCAICGRTIQNYHILFHKKVCTDDRTCYEIAKKEGTLPKEFERKKITLPVRQHQQG